MKIGEIVREDVREVPTPRIQPAEPQKSKPRRERVPERREREPERVPA